MTHSMAYIWQKATNFNQNLAWDTSAVTNMEYMFLVRAAAAQTRVAPLERAAQQSQFQSILQAMTRAMAYTWQFVTNFNHNLAWDTSAVTDMGGMFQVRATAARTRVAPFERAALQTVCECNYVF